MNADTDDDAVTSLSLTHTGHSQSTMVQPLLKGSDKVQKRSKTFKKYQSDRFKRLQNTSWRRPKGIDSRERRKFKGLPPMPNVGYGTAKKYKHVLPSGFLKFVVHNVKDLDMLLMHNRKYAAEIAHGVSTLNRKAIVERARQLNVKVTNGAARLRSEEDE